MKKICRLLPVVLLLLVSAQANAQLGNVLNRAKNAVQQGISRTTQQASGTIINAVEGNDKGDDTGKVTNALSSVVEDQKPTIPEGPEIPELMTKSPSFNSYDATGQYMNSIAWGLRKTSNEEARQLAAKLTARAKWDRQTLAEIEAGKYEYEYDQKMKIENELADWTNFYSVMGGIVSSHFTAELKKDENGLWFYQGNTLFSVGMRVTGVPASEEGVIPGKATLFTSRDNKAFFCTSSYEPTVASAEQIEMAKRDFNMMVNIAILFEGYPVDYCYETERGVMADDYDVYYQKALFYASTVKQAIDNNSPDNIEFKPMPKAGALNGSLKAQALAAEKLKRTDLVDIVITSDSWEVQTNALGVPIRRVIYGYSIVKTDLGKMANRVSWSEDYQGGSYGKLHAYGVGAGGSFYVK
ncbi:MAG: hypothetical protein IKX62_00185 [Bacteroidales bacterium]|nr:hypothetical protein [Bacteroidales bacterium]